MLIFGVILHKLGHYNVKKLYNKIDKVNARFSKLVVFNLNKETTKQ